MKKQYEAATIEVVYTVPRDVIATSSPFDSEEQPLSLRPSGPVF